MITEVSPGRAQEESGAQWKLCQCVAQLPLGNLFYENSQIRVVRTGNKGIFPFNVAIADTYKLARKESEACWFTEL